MIRQRKYLPFYRIEGKKKNCEMIVKIPEMTIGRFKRINYAELPR